MDDKHAALWHAFNALDDQKKGTCVKSQLKVNVHISGNKFANFGGLSPKASYFLKCFKIESLCLS